MEINEKQIHNKAKLHEIQGFHYYFINKHGYYLVFERTPSIQCQDISIFQIKMMEANNIPRLLKINVREVDEEIKIYYSLNQKKTLSNQMKISGLSEVSLCVIFLQFVLALQQTKNFMLNEQNFLFDIDFIFVGEDFNDIYLTYVPFKNQINDKHIHVELKKVLNQMKFYLKDVNCKVFNEIAKACKDSFSFVELKHMLLDLISRLSESSLEARNLISVNGLNELLLHSNGTHGKEKYENDFTESDELIAIPSENKVHPIQIFDDRGFSPKRFDSSSQQESTNEFDEIHSADEINFYSLTLRLRILTSICISLSLYILWNLVLSKQTEPYLYIGAGSSLCLVAFWTMVCFLGFPRIWSWKLFFGIFHIQFKAESKKNYIDSPENNGSSSNQPFQDYLSSEQYYNELPLRTTLIDKDLKQTTLLNSSEQQAVIPTFQKRTMPKAYLIDNQQVDIIKIFIEKDVFRIGRIQNGVEMMINESGVSRLHAEILKTDDGYVIKDLQSKNGVVLNNIRIVPYQTHSLQDGDVIQIVRKEYVFRIN